MGWNPDREPIEYLERRLRYYKRKNRKLKGYLIQPVPKFQAAYHGSAAKFKIAVKRAIDLSFLRIAQFTAAINKLKE